jgi:hypothetical protein
LNLRIAEQFSLSSLATKWTNGEVTTKFYCVSPLRFWHLSITTVRITLADVISKCVSPHISSWGHTLHSAKLYILSTEVTVAQ